MSEEEEKSDGPCEMCGKPGWLTFEPFAEEIYGEKVEVILCSECYAESCMDI